MLAEQLDATVQLNCDQGTEFQITFKRPATVDGGEQLHGWARLLIVDTQTMIAAGPAGNRVNFFTGPGRGVKVILPCCRRVGFTFL